MGPLSWLAQAPVVGRAPLVPAAGAAVSGIVTAVTLIAGGLLDHQHADSDRVLAEAPAAIDTHEVPSYSIDMIEVPTSDRAPNSMVPSSSAPAGGPMSGPDPPPGRRSHRQSRQLRPLRT